MWQTIGAQHGALPFVSADRRRDGRQGLHPRASVRRSAQALAVAIARGGFEYQGQKCSAASRVYVPRSLWPEVRDRLVAIMETCRWATSGTSGNFVGAVIDRQAFSVISEYIRHAQANARIIAGGNADDSRGLLHRADAGRDRRSGPSAHARGDLRAGAHGVRVSGPPVGATLEPVDATSPYALTGAVFAPTAAAIARGATALRNAPATSTSTTSRRAPWWASSRSAARRGSGTNDKAGSKLNLVRWVSARVIKETFVPPADYPYPFMKAE